jgi:fumarate reductase subunit D
MEEGSFEQEAVMLFSVLASSAMVQLVLPSLLLLLSTLFPLGWNPVYIPISSPTGVVVLPIA